jgi:hypothetical protein
MFWINSNKKLLLLVISSIFILIKVLLINPGVFYNPDEFDWIYCTNNLINSNYYFNSFDSQTTGPLSIYLLGLSFNLIGEVNIYNLHLIRYILEFITIFIIVKSDFRFKKVTIVVIILELFLSLPTKDILAYNTEFIALPFITWLYCARKSENYLLEAIVIFALPIIKFQLIIFSFYFFAIHIIKLFNKYDRKKFILFCWIYTFILLSIMSFLFVSRDSMISFNYFFRNFAYVQNNNISFSSKLVNFVSHKITLLICFVILVTVFYFRPYIKKYLYTLYASDLIFLFVSLVTVFVPANGFVHYYVLCFVPTGFLVSTLIYESKFNFMRLNVFFSLSISLIIIGQILLTSDTLVFSKQDIVSLNNDESLNESEFISTLDSLIVTRNEIQNEKPRVLFTGWFSSQALYYRYMHTALTSYRGSNTYFFHVLTGENLRKLESQFISDIQSKGKLDIIVVTPEYPITNKYFTKLIQENYSMYLNHEHGKVYLMKELF